MEYLNKLGVFYFVLGSTMRQEVGKPSRSLSFSLSTTDFCREENVKVIVKVKRHTSQGHRCSSGPCVLKETAPVN